MKLDGSRASERKMERDPFIRGRLRGGERERGKLRIDRQARSLRNAITQLLPASSYRPFRIRVTS